MVSKRLAVSSALVLAASIVGCSAPTEEGLGVAQIAITNVPVDGSVRCIQVTATGGFTTTQSLDVSPGQSTFFDLTGLPVGTVRFDGHAYPSPCALVAPPEVPTWVSDPALVTVGSGQPAMVMLFMHQNGSATVGVDFPGNTCRGDGAPCFSGGECCSQFCAPDNTCQSPNTCVPDGAGCMIPSDCCSGSCTNGVCGSFNVCPPGGTQCGPLCTNLASDPYNCGACGLVCPTFAQCLGGACVPGFPSCADGIRNGSETDVDCGGSCAPCTNGHMCATSSDCLSGACINNICQPSFGCQTPGDCPPTSSPCAIPACLNNACQLLFLPPGTVAPAQAPGDCQKSVCDGTGNLVSIPDDTDIPPSFGQCFAATCTQGVPALFPLAAGTVCTENGGMICDGNGHCL